MLSLITFFPLIGVFTIACVPKARVRVIRSTALLSALINVLFSLILFGLFEASNGGFQFEEQRSWIATWGVTYHVGVDGISLLLVVLTALLTFLALWASWTDITRGVKGFAIAMLFLESAMIGVFVSLDLFLFYVYWEAMLVPMYVLIGIWGGPARIYAAIKFFLYTMLGSVLMLVGILALYFTVGKNSFDLLVYYGTTLSPQLQYWLFLAFFLAFAVKVPLFPFHTWLPDAHVEAPTAGSVILAGILLKMGVYGFLRFSLPLFPMVVADFLPFVLGLAVIGIIYGALVAMVQKDMKKLVAYSSVSHLGFVVVGVFTLNAQGLSGGILQMVNHGLSTGALFLMVGMLYERSHSRMIDHFGGLASSMPMFATFFLIVILSSIGLPGLNGFIGEFLILLGAFRGQHTVYASVATVGIVLAAVYMLWMFQRVMFGPLKETARALEMADLRLREGVILGIMVFFMVLIGVYPQPFLGKMEKSVESLINRVNRISVVSEDLSPLASIHYGR